MTKSLLTPSRAERGVIAAAKRFVWIWENTAVNWLRLDDDFVAMVKAVERLKKEKRNGR